MSHPSKKSAPTRRKFLQVLSVAFLSGCSRLDSNPYAQQVLSWFDRWNYKVGGMLASPRRLARTYPRSAVQPEQMRPNGSVVTPGARRVDTPEADWRLAASEVRLEKGKVVARHWTRKYTLDELKEMPPLSLTVEHICVEGWSAICHWKGLSLRDFIGRHPLRPESRYVYLLCDDAMITQRGLERYSVTFDLASALHPQNVLAYEYNGEKLPVAHGAPLRLAAPTHVGWKSAKYLRYIFFTNEDMGGFWENQGYPRYYGF